MPHIWKPPNTRKAAAPETAVTAVAPVTAVTTVSLAPRSRLQHPRKCSHSRLQHCKSGRDRSHCRQVCSSILPRHHLHRWLGIPDTLGRRHRLASTSRRCRSGYISRKLPHSASSASQFHVLPPEDEQVAQPPQAVLVPSHTPSTQDAQLPVQPFTQVLFTHFSHPVHPAQVAGGQAHS